MISIAIIGVGPRGMSVLERIVENAREVVDEDVCVHAVEPRALGSGDVWRTDQSNELIMNIVASQITAYTDDSVQIEGPIRPGPSLYEWAQRLAGGEIVGDYPDAVLEEAARVGPNSYCRRSFYGHYLQYVHSQILRNLPPHVWVRGHATRAVRLSDATGSARQIVELADGTQLVVDEVVLALGHGRLRLSDEERRFAAFADATGGTYLPPRSPADVDHGAVEPGADVIVRGLGLCLFDHLALLTTGRGGRFVRPGGRLEYRRSGGEPRIVCGSRRGVPLHARAENEKGDRRYEPLFLTEPAIAALRTAAGPNGVIDFGGACWPLIAKEVETVYYSRLVAEATSAENAQQFTARYASAPWNSPAEQLHLRDFGVAPQLRWSWETIARPWRRDDVADLPRWDRFLRSYLAADIREARRGNVSSPLKAAVDVLRDIRNEIRYVLNNGGVESRSYEQDVVGWFNTLHAFLSIGPPWSRVEELVALIEAGVVRVAGPEFTVEADAATGRFRSRSRVPGDVAHSGVVIDAMLPRVDLTRSRSSLLIDLARTGQVTDFVVGRSYRTGGVAVAQRPFRPVRPDGSTHPHRYVFGIPTEGANWVTETGIRPNVNSITLGDSDAIARAALGRGPAMPMQRRPDNAARVN